MKGKKSKIWHEVICDVHGTKPMSKGNEKNKVVVLTVKGERAERTAGCPICNAEKR